MSEQHSTMPSWWMPRAWHGMTPSVWLRLLAANRFAISPSRIPLALGVSLFCGSNLVLAGLHEAIFGRRARAAKLSHPPLFILGHWRTGTTMLHELLARDPRMSYPNTWDCMAPWHFLLTAPVTCRWFNWLLPKARPQDDMALGFDRPQEDEFALMNLGAGSPYLEWAFPNRGPRSEYLTLETLSAERREYWKHCLDWFIRRLSLRNPAARIVLKSPTHTARVKLLLELYPDARFVHIVRDPRVVIPSTVRTWQRLADAEGLQVRRERPLEDQVLDTFELMYERFELDQASIPADQFCELRYDDLIARPVAELEAIYQRLGLGDFEPARAAVQGYLDGVKNYKTNRFQPDPALIAKITRRCGGYMRRYGYATPDQARLAPVAQERS